MRNHANIAIIINSNKIRTAPVWLAQHAPGTPTLLAWLGEGAGKRFKMFCRRLQLRLLAEFRQVGVLQAGSPQQQPPTGLKALRAARWTLVMKVRFMTSMLPVLSGPLRH